MAIESTNRVERNTHRIAKRGGHIRVTELTASLNGTDTSESTIEVFLRSDLKEAARTLGPAEARYLVDTYYQVQTVRLESQGRYRAGREAAEPSVLMRFSTGEFLRMEGSIQAALDAYTDEQPMGRWARSIVGIGPVLAAGLLAHVDITQAPTVGHIWRFAGLDPTLSWDKGQKRPWNAKLKVICWKIGESFIKVQNRPGDVYGHIYAERKRLEIERNEAGAFAEQAAAALTRRRFGDDTAAKAAYLQGRLPPAHIHARARRYAVKLFLAHYHETAYEQEYGRKPPLPYPIAILGHAHYLAPPVA